MTPEQRAFLKKVKADKSLSVAERMLTQPFCLTLNKTGGKGMIEALTTMLITLCERGNPSPEEYAKRLLDVIFVLKAEAEAGIRGTEH